MEVDKLSDGGLSKISDIFFEERCSDNWSITDIIWFAVSRTNTITDFSLQDIIID